MSYHQFTQKIRKYRRDELIFTCAQQCWQAWDKRNLEFDPHFADTKLLNSLTPRIFSISAAVGSNFNRSAVEGETLSRLLRNLISIKDPELSKRNAITIDKYVELVNKSKILKDLGLTRQQLELADVFSIIQRLSRPQLENQNNSFADAMRGLLIFKETDTLSKGLLTEIVKSRINLSPEDFYKAALTVFTLINEQSKEVPGLLRLDDSVKIEELQRRFGISIDTLKLASSRMSLSYEDLKRWHGGVEKKNSNSPQNYPLPLFDHPLYFIGENEFSFLPNSKSTHLHYLAPSPNLFLGSLRTSLLRTVAAHKDALGTFNLLSKIGEAIESYLNNYSLKSLFPEAQVTCVSKSSKKEADFIVEFDEFILIIESKRSINDALARNLAEPSDVVLSWERMLGAFSQCASTRNDLRSTKTIINLVLCEEEVLDDANYFLGILDETSFLMDNNIQYTTVMSLAEFENHFYQKNATEVLQFIKTNWDKYRSTRNKASFITDANSEIPNHSVRRITHLDSLFQELFSEIK